jgi:hypothetical protein
MTASRSPLSRRHAALMLAAAPLLRWGSRARAASALPHPTAPVSAIPFPNGVTILVAGPNGGGLCRWADAIGAGLARSLPSGTAVRKTCAGGTDGVTAANQFDARVPPDGSTVLLTPGAAALDWLVGDPRAHFDAGHWVPVMAAVAPALVMVRAAAGPIHPGRTIRIAAASPAGPQLPALLGLELLGVHLAPKFGMVDQSQIVAAFARGAVDAALVWGENVPRQIELLRGAGGRPLFALAQAGAEAPGPSGLAEVPTLAALHQSWHGGLPAGPRLDAYHAAASAIQLTFGLVLPRLTSAAMVALWRRAAESAIEDPELQAMADAQAVQPLQGIAAAAAATGVSVDVAALLELRGWLAARFNWRPS